MNEILAIFRSGLEVLRGSNIVYVAAALAVYVASTIIYGIRLYIALLKIRVPSTFRTILAAYLVSILVNNITPAARAGGELSRALFIVVRTGRKYAGRILSAIAYERVTEGLAVALLALTLAITGLTGSNTYPILLLSLFLIAAIVLVVHYWDKVINLVLTRIPDKLRKSFVDDDERVDAYNYMHVLTRDYILLAVMVGLGFLAWILDAVRIHYVAVSVGAPLGMRKAIVISLLYLAIGLLAITPGGIGVVEGGLTLVLASLGIAYGKAFAITIIERIISYGVGSLLGALALAVAGGRRVWRRLR